MGKKKSSYLSSRPFTAYKGEDPYIFVSYAHTDHEEVYVDIEVLHKKGYRIWYDEGIGRGQLLAEAIQEAISGCQYFIAFLSPDAIESDYVKKEIHLALEEKKQFLAIHLRETELKYGLKLLLGPMLAVLKYEYDPSRDVYFKELEKSIPSSLKQEIGPAKDSLEKDFEREIDFRIKEAHKQSKSLTEEMLKNITEKLLETAELLGLSKDSALKIINEKISPKIEEDYVERFEKLRELVIHFLISGEIPAERRVILANRAKALRIQPEDWEKLVQEEAVLKAKEVLESGKVEIAKRILISSVGNQVPQLEEVRSLLEKLEEQREAPIESEGKQIRDTEAEKITIISKPAVPDHAITKISEDAFISWIRIPAGLFIRGCPEEFMHELNQRYPNLNVDVLRTFPVRKEPIEEFWMSVTSITNAQYHRFVKAKGHRYPAGWRGTTPPYPKNDHDKPVTGVTWQDSQDFAEWIGARLPTRAEYEKACRGEDGQLFPWGNTFDESKCNTAESGINHVTPADAYPSGASVYGILDLVGNVWEWAADEKVNLKMTVGASYEWQGEIYGVGFYDLSRPPDSSEKDIGFRVACSDIEKLDVMKLEYTDVPEASNPQNNEDKRKQISTERYISEY